MPHWIIGGGIEGDVGEDVRALLSLSLSLSLCLSLPLSLFLVFPHSVPLPSLSQLHTHIYTLYKFKNKKNSPNNQKAK